MKKILLVMSVAILMALFSAPSFVKADTEVGTVFVNYDGYYYVTPLYADIDDVDDAGFTVTTITSSSNQLYGVDYLNFNGRTRPLYFHSDLNPETTIYLYKGYCVSGCIPTLNYPYSYEWGDATRTIYISLDTFYDSIPEDFRPNPSMSEQLWDAFYDFFETIFGYRPLPGSIYDILRNGAEGEDVEITFPTLTPTPTPTPTTTPIPVQTIFVPDGNGNTTIIYQYPDPTTGVITQSPYNPNIDNNITVICDCDGGGGGSETFTSNPQDPYTLDSSLLWADGFGVQITDNPLDTVNQQQTTLKEAAMEYDAAVNVASNSFNILPLKWIALCGLAGGILIIAGLIRTFLGG